MDITSIIIVSLIVSAFLLFASVLVYGDIATRQARRAQANKVTQAAQAPSLVYHRETPDYFLGRGSSLK